MIRVGGRLQNSILEFDQKHQIILPKGHILTKLILRNEHCRLLHCGVQQLICSIREKFWPISLKNSCKIVIKSCIVCFRAKPKSSELLNGKSTTFHLNKI